MAVTYRVLDGQEVKDVRSMICRTIDASYPRAYPQKAIDFFKDYHSEESITIDAKNGRSVVAISDGRIVGTGTLVGEEIKRVFVDPSFQGRGIGRGIMERLIEEARAKRLGRIRLDASFVSLGMYEHLGFRRVRDGCHDLGGGTRLDYQVMELDL